MTTNGTQINERDKRAKEREAKKIAEAQEAARSKLTIMQRAALQKPILDSEEKAKAEAEAKAKAEEEKAKAEAHAKKPPIIEAKKAVLTEEDRQKFLLALRVKLFSGLEEKFKDKNVWDLSPEKEIKDPKISTFKVVNKKGDAGCQMTMNQEEAKFKLASASDDSYEAAKNCLDSYLESYEEWRKLDPKYQKEDRDLIYDLTVYNESHIKPFLEKLGDLNLTKITIIDALGSKKVITDPEQIASYKSKPPVNSTPKLI